LGRTYGDPSTIAEQRHAGSQQGTAAAKTLSASSEQPDRLTSAPSQAPGNSEEIPASATAQSVSPEVQKGSIENQIEIQKQSESPRVVRVPVSDFSGPATRAPNATETDTTQANARLPQTAQLGVAATIKSSEQVASRSVQAVTKIGQTEIHAHTGQVQAGVPASDPAAPSLLTRDPASQQGATSQTRDNNTASTIPASGVALPETFASLDAGADHATPNWTHAGTQRVEAGFQDPALGWVGVRADVNAGGVHAIVMPGTADAAQALGGHMAGLNAYLAAEHTPVTSVTLASLNGNEASIGGNQGMSQGTGQNPGDQASMAAFDSPELSASAGGPITFAEIPRPEGSSFSAMA
jgi:hypothetical protein